MSASTAAPAPKVTPTKPKKDRERKEKQPIVSERLKSVVRRLPPNLPEDIFWGTVTAWISDETVSWKAYYPGKLKKRLNKENIPSRAYIAFKKEEQLASFGREFDGHVFRDKEGNDYQAVVEFAPYQKIPSEKKKPDARTATIEQDEDYISFIESLKTSANIEHPSMESLRKFASDLTNYITLTSDCPAVAASQLPPPPKTTPLLEALKAEKTANKDKEAILRNHAHYKDPSILASVQRKETEHGKKKGGAAQKAADPAPSGLSKRAAKKQAQAEAAQKAAAAASNSAKNASQNPSVGSSNTAPASNKSPRPPRVHKPAPQAQVKPPPKPPAASASTAATSSSAPAPVTQSATSVPGASSSLGGSAPASAVPAKDPTPSRRSRPVIGIPSRQFEAALSSAGVASASTGKPRRERGEGSEGQQQRNEAGTDSSAVATMAATANQLSGSQSVTRAVPPAKAPGLLHPPPAGSQTGGGPSQRGASLRGGERGGGRGGGRGRGRGRGRGSRGGPDAPARGE